MRSPQTHYIRSNHVERSPRRLLVYDTETESFQVDEGEELRLRLWAARLVTRGDAGPKNPVDERAWGRTAAELAAFIDHSARAYASTWVAAHNASFDLVVGQVPELLLELGWELTQHALFSQAPWARFRKGSRHLTLFDSYSHLPRPLASIAEGLGIPRPDLPDAAATEEEWLARCRADVDALTAALLQLMDWWDAQQLGNFSLTGPSSGWSAMRHHPRFGRVLIRPDQEAAKLERDALAGGYRTVSRIGRLRPGLYADVDFQRAHLTVMANMRLPVNRGQRFLRLPLTTPYLRTPAVDILARCRIRTTSPYYPLRYAGAVWYPVGEWWAVLSGPEIREAKARGELLEIREGYPYIMGDPAQGWARWVEELLAGSDPELPPMAYVALKGWSRSVEGRWAARTSRKAYTVRADIPGWRIEEGAILPGPVTATFLTRGNVREAWLRDQEADDAFPAVLAFIQGHTRVLLARMLRELGSAVVQSNTDGCLVDVDEMRRNASLAGKKVPRTVPKALEYLEAVLESYAPHIAPMRLVVKRTGGRGEVLSPAHVVLDNDRMLSGIPRQAELVAPQTWTFDAWPGTSTQWGRELGQGYLLQRRRVSLAKLPVAAWRMADGSTRPVRAYIGKDGQNAIEPYRADLFDGAELAPIEVQHTALRRLMREEAGTGWAGVTTGRVAK